MRKKSPEKKEMADLHRNNAYLITNLLSKKAPIILTSGGLQYRLSTKHKHYKTLVDLINVIGNDHTALALTLEEG